MPHGGRITLVGAGHRLAGQVTAEVEAHLRRADQVFHLLDEPVAARWVLELNPMVRGLLDCYRPGRSGFEALEAMAERVLAPARAGLAVCVAFPGHPSIAVPPVQEILKRARAEGLSVSLLPGVSALDCLFADLGIDPACSGWQVFEATDFLLQRRRFDPTSALVLLQAGSIGLRAYARENPERARRLALLAEVLRESYPAEHELVVYHASPYPVSPSRIERVPLARLAAADVSIDTTLYVSPLAARPVDAAMLARIDGRPPVPELGRSSGGGGRGE